MWNLKNDIKFLFRLRPDLMVLKHKNVLKKTANENNVSNKYMYFVLIGQLWCMSTHIVLNSFIMIVRPGLLYHVYNSIGNNLIRMLTQTNISYYLLAYMVKFNPLHWLIWFDLLCLTPLSAIFQLCHCDQFSGGRSRSTQRELPNMCKQLVNFITCSWESNVHFFL